ncbi:MAG TPA: LysR family transcriptional regulator [Bryobacteraceae bacterium]|jgi:DNA-binding transcriptional LysR family regulator|nr:LysR family transcriptional regulator [Bryobacteraceae bacterium]
MMGLVLFDNSKLFRDIAQLKSVSRGAAHHGISQSAASQHIQELERKLGISLFDRGTRPLTLTAAGKLYLDLCRDVLRREEEFTAGLDALKATVEGEVRVASIYSIGLSEMSRLREEFAQRFPEAQLQVVYLRPQKIYEALLEDQADLGLVSYPEATRDLSVVLWREEEMVVAVVASHPLTSKAILLPSDLEGQDFIGFDEDLSIRRELDRFFREQGVGIRMAMQFDNIQMIKEAVALGSGISILPARTMLAEIEQGRLAAVPLHAPGLVRPLGIVYRKKKKFNRATQVFLELLQEAPDMIGAVV